MRTNREPHSDRLHVRLTATEVAALDFLAAEWQSDRSKIVRSMIIGAAMAQLDRLNALDAAEAGFDAPLADVPSVFAWNE